MPSEVADPGLVGNYDLGGEYQRPLSPRRARYIVGAGGFDRIEATLVQWTQDKESDPAKREAVIELAGSGACQEQITIRLQHGDRLTLRAALRCRPVG